jgi:hypothetical protein
VALLIQHATRMRHIVTSVVPPLASPHFSLLSHKRHDSWKKLLDIKCVFLYFLYNFTYNISHFNDNSVRYFHKG